MKKLVTIVLFGCVCFLLILPGQARAMYDTQTCKVNALCVSTVIWGNGAMFPIVGAQTNLTVSNPGLSGNGDWFRDLAIYAADSAARIDTGIEKTGTSLLGTFCSSPANAPEVFIETVTTSGTSHISCLGSVPTGDINAQATVAINRQSDGSYEVQWMFKNGDGPCKGGGCSLYQISAPVYHFILMKEDVFENWSNSHLVWGSAWGYNKYQDPSTRNFYFQPKADCFVPGSSGGCASMNSSSPLFYWNILPQDSSTGGEVYSCDYDPSVKPCVYAH